MNINVVKYSDLDESVFTEKDIDGKKVISINIIDSNSNIDLGRDYSDNLDNTQRGYAFTTENKPLTVKLTQDECISINRTKTSRLPLTYEYQLEATETETDFGRKVLDGSSHAIGSGMSEYPLTDSPYVNILYKHDNHTLHTHKVFLDSSNISGSTVTFNAPSSQFNVIRPNINYILNPPINLEQSIPFTMEYYKQRTDVQQISTFSDLIFIRTADFRDLSDTVFITCTVEVLDKSRSKLKITNVVANINSNNTTIDINSIVPSMIYQNAGGNINIESQTSSELILSAYSNSEEEGYILSINIPELKLIAQVGLSLI